MKLKDYILYWYKTYRQPGQARTTQITTMSCIRNHLLTAPLSEKELAEIHLRDLQTFLMEEYLHGKKTKLKHVDLTGEPLSAYTMTKLRQILIAVFRQAEKEGLIVRNIALDTSPIPIRQPKESPVFTPEAQRKFLQATKSHRFYTAYVLAFYLGCRRSELLGLSWDSINFKRNFLTIRQVVVLEDGVPVVRPRTKARNSLRTIPFPKEIRLLLQEHRQRQKKEQQQPGYHNEYNLVFANKDGTPHNPAYFSRNFKATIKRLPFLSNDLHLHSARHSWATNMIQCGISITDVQALGGWSRADTLLNIYAHSVKESQRKAMKKLYRELQ